MQYLSASCIIPVSGEPCYDSALVITDHGTVEGVFQKSDLKVSPSEIRHYDGILCPGFVNTHCHLELSWAKGLIPKGGGLDSFVRQLETAKKAVSESTIQQSVAEAASEMEQSGIVATADITNGNHTLLHKSKSNHHFHTFVEVFGSNPAYAAAVFEKALGLKTQFEDVHISGRVSIVPHATYSLSDELFRLVARAAEGSLISIHHQENEDENAFFMDGTGPIADRRNAFNPGLIPFSGSGKRPLESIAAYFSPGQKILLVHNTVSELQDIEFTEEYFRQAYWCMCPNANLYIENRLPDINLFRSQGCRITLGTDSLASNRQLSILEEIKTLQQHFPGIPLSELVRWGTLNGAEFLGSEHKLGSFDKGKRPGVVLIENAGIHTFKLTSKSTSRLLIPAGDESNTE